jgi:hypothetical protein
VASISRARRASLVPIVALAITFAACADVDRTLTDRDFLRNNQGIVERSVVWESNRYPDHQTHAGDACWEAAAIGQPTPTQCLSRNALFEEADLYAQFPTPATLGGLLIVAAFIWFAFRRIAWQPSVARSTSSGATERPSGSAVALMRHIEDERVAQRAASGARRDVRWPLPTGAGFALAVLAVLTLLFGYAATLAWSVTSGAFMLIALAVAVIWLLLRFPPRPPDPDAHISRLLFLGGATAVFLIGAFLASYIHWPMLELNGIWLLA